MDPQHSHGFPDVPGQGARVAVPPPTAADPLPDLLGDSPALPLWARAAFAAAGIALTALGVAVWLIPVVGGSIFFYAAGFLLLGRSSRRIRAAVNRAERKLPGRVRRVLRLQMRRRSAAPPQNPFT